MYILPWTTLGRQKKKDHWTPGSLAGQVGGSLGEMTDQNLFESLDEHMARPTSYMFENVDFRPCWTRIWLFNHVSTRVLGDSSFFTNINTLGAWERLLEAIRGVGKLSLLFLGSPFSSMEVLPLLGLRGWWATKLEEEMRMGGANGAWSSIQEPWEMDCFYFMVPISSLFFNFVKP